MKINEVIQTVDEVSELTHIRKRKGKWHPEDPTTEKQLIKIGGKQIATMPDGHKVYLEKDPRGGSWNSYYAVSPDGKVDLTVGATEQNNVLSDISLYAVNKNNTLKAHNFYAFLITKLGKTLVASSQSPGGHAVWKQLQRFHKNISIHGWLNDKPVNVDMRDPEYTHAPEGSDDDWRSPWKERDPEEISDARNMKLVATKRTK